MPDPRPIYRADGGKIFDVYSWPYRIRAEIKADLGEFPFFGFWGPAAGVKTPRGAADCATRWIAGSRQVDGKQALTGAEPGLSAALGLQFTTAWAISSSRRGNQAQS